MTLNAFGQRIDETLSSYPKIILKIMNQIPRWSPDLTMSDTCKQNLQSKILQPDQCRAQYQLNFFDSFRSKLFFDFDAIEKYNFKNIDLVIQNKIKVRGLLGLHSNKKKPLIIFRMGIHGNRDEFLAEKFLIRILYQELGYHVLMIESLTSHGFIVENNELSVGGTEEGLHTSYILNLIHQKKFDWVNQVSSIHLMGISMGSEGIFLATYLDEKMNHLLKSSTVFCPLVSLQKNFDRLSEPGLKNAFADLWNSRRLQAIKQKDEKLAKINLWPMLFNLKPLFAPAVFQWLDQKRIKPLFSVNDFEKEFGEVKLPSEFKKHLNSSQGLFKFNHFWPVFENKVTPITIVSTADDQVVFNDLNTEMIRSKKQPGVFKNTKFVDLKGFHCSLAEEYQWPFLVELVKRSVEGI